MFKSALTLLKVILEYILKMILPLNNNNKNGVYWKYMRGHVTTIYLK